MTIQIDAHETEVLNSYRAQGTMPQARHAAVILLSAEGRTVSQIGAAVQLSKSRIYSIRRTWREKGLAMFDEFEESDDSAGSAQSAPGGRPELWQDDEALIEPPHAVQPGVLEPRLPLTLAESVGIVPDDPMSEAARKVLLFHFERMLFHEPGSRTGEDIESVHDMRVATRRMRSALRLCRPFFEPDALRRHTARLRKTAQVLGAVRDLDVLIDKANLFAAEHDPALDLSPLLDQWERERIEARERLVRLLDSRKFARFVEKFHAFLTTPGAGARPLPADGAPAAYQVRHIVPRLIYAHYEQVRAFEPVLDGASVETLHALRIEFKRLRYALEFFREVLGPEAKAVISVVKTAQDHLGDLHDAAVGEALLASLLDSYNREFSGVPVFMRPDISGVAAYAEHVRAERARLIETFPQVWAAFMDEDTRRNLALAVAVL